ncbi:hypothetical protein RHSIM_Rhsim13G0132800 [Rhododendron simsii]|uniref:Pectin lyase-like superfamily protein n=1 Tax=Rhododendron simsii TaxID=118357 RepID=A0A834G0G3_RHOSS|nr:hypothetical protein RHSIM_Rhsim13G0132800 [Rhododendron simsii]
MELTLARRALMLSIVMLVGLASLIAGNISGQNSLPVGHFPTGLYRDHVQNMQSFKASFSGSLYRDRGRRSLPPTSDSPSPSLAPSPPPLVNQSPRLYHVTSYGPDPTGKTEGPDALFNAITNAFNQGLSDGFLMKGIANLGGAEVNFEEGTYSINRPLHVPTAGRGNFRVRMLSKVDDFSMN